MSAKHEVHVERYSYQERRAIFFNKTRRDDRSEVLTASCRACPAVAHVAFDLRGKPPTLTTWSSMPCRAVLMAVADELPALADVQPDDFWPEIQKKIEDAIRREDYRDAERWRYFDFRSTVACSCGSFLITRYGFCQPCLNAMAQKK